MKCKILSDWGFSLADPANVGMGCRHTWDLDCACTGWGRGAVETIFSYKVVETIFSFKVNGTELTGTVTNAQGKTVIREGKINGDEISFVVIRSVGGNEKKAGV